MLEPSGNDGSEEKKIDFRDGNQITYRSVSSVCRHDKLFISLCIPLRERPLIISSRGEGGGLPPNDEN